jgi:hypothetical protein
VGQAIILLGTRKDESTSRARSTADIWGNYKWDDQSSTVFWGELSTTSTPSPTMTPGGVLNLVYMTSGSGLWLIRFRNVKTSTCGTINPTGPANGTWPDPSLWMTQQWNL